MRLDCCRPLLSALGMALVILMVGRALPGGRRLDRQARSPAGRHHAPRRRGLRDDHRLDAQRDRRRLRTARLAYTGISVAAASTAGEEEAGILGLTLAYPIERSRLLLDARPPRWRSASRWSPSAPSSGSSSGSPSAEAASVGAHRRAVAAPRVLRLGGRRARARGGRVDRAPALASGTAAAFAVLGFLLNGFAPLVDAIEWLKYLSLFHYYEGHDPIGNGVDASDLAVLAAVALACTLLALVGLRQRDLRK